MAIKKKQKNKHISLLLLLMDTERKVDEVSGVDGGDDWDVPESKNKIYKKQLTLFAE